MTFSALVLLVMTPPKVVVPVVFETMSVAADVPELVTRPPCVAVSLVRDATCSLKPARLKAPPLNTCRSEASGMTPAAPRRSRPPVTFVAPT